MLGLFLFSEIHPALIKHFQITQHSAMRPSIQITSLTKSFPLGRHKNKVLHNLSLTVLKGETFGFLGPNGAGKSTTIKLLLNFLRPDTGSIQILNHTVGQGEFRHHIGYLSESPVFYEHLTAKETLLLSGRLSNIPSVTIKQRIPNLLKKMNLAHATNIRVKSFSKGMKQRLGMANALVHDPKVLIFDEPMSGLDPLGRHMIKELFKELKRQNKTIFFSSHILGDIEELCDNIAIIHKGHLLYTGDLPGFLQGKSLEEGFVNTIQEKEDAKFS